MPLLLLPLEGTQPTRRLGFGSAHGTGQAGSFGIYRTEVPETMSVELLDPAAPYTVLATFPESWERSFRDVPSGVGAGTMRIALDDAAAALVTNEKMLRWKVNGRVAMQSLIESLTRVSIAQGEEAEESYLITGRSLVAILEEAVVYPPRGPASLPIADVRTFNFADVDFDDSGWGSPWVLAHQSTAAWPWIGLPARWPAGGAAWMWAPHTDTVFAPSGTCYFRKWFNVPAGISQITFCLAIDDDGELWIDGQKMLEMVGFADYRTVTFPVTPGVHLVAIKARNDPQYVRLLPGSPAIAWGTHTVVSGDTLWDIAGTYYGDPTKWPTIYDANKAQIDAAAAAAGLPYTGRHAGHWIFSGQVFDIPGYGGQTPATPDTWFNPAGVLCAAYEATKNGLGALLLDSNGGWKCLPYPVNEPGMTPGEVVNILVNEARFRGCFPQLATTFGPRYDSAGRPWRQVGDISVRVGDDYITVLQQLAETYVDFVMSPSGLTLHMYDIENPEPTPGATYTDGWDITSLSHLREG